MTSMTHTVTAIRERELFPVAMTTSIMAVLFVALPAARGAEVNSFSVYSAMQVFATYGLVALALGATMVAAHFDLSALGMFVLGGMVAVKAGGGSPVVGVCAAVAVGVVSGLVQGTVVAKLEINSMSVTLGGYLILLGASRAVGNNQTVSYDNIDVGIALAEPVAGVLSAQSIIVLAIFAVIGVVMSSTRLGREVRAVGGDARASRVAGVRTDAVTIGVFVLSGSLAAIAGSLNAFTIGSALANPGFAPLVFGATAALIGGVALAGGRGTAAGIALGVLTLSLLQSMFGMLASPTWVSSAATGSLLIVASISASPRRAEQVARARRQFRRPPRSDLSTTHESEQPIS